MQPESRASETAEGVAALRHAATREPDPAIRGPDGLAFLFLGAKMRLLAGPLRRLALALYARRLPGIYAWVIARTQHYDRLLAREVAGGIAQVVLLGAGYDTRAVRFGRELRQASARMWEVDHPATQARKKRRLGARRVDHVAYVPADFRAVSLEEVLLAAGWEHSRRTLFLWEGVTMYLTADAVQATLRCVARAAPGSVLAFDFCTRAMVEGQAVPYGAAEVRRFLAARGEPLTWGLDPEEVGPFLAGHGLRLRQHLGPEEVEQRYLLKSDGTLFGRVTGYNHLAEATR